MGTVHSARDELLRRDVATKTLHARLSADESRVAQFVEEAQITGQLEHPNIVPVHDVGVDANGQPYFTMKLVRGQNLWDWLSAPTRPVGSADRLSAGLEIFMKVCDGIAFAHSRGVIHRDLKPGNIMVGDFGEVLVMDWGLARIVGSHADVVGARGGATDPGGIVGTPAYMAPEQAIGGELGDELTDVFGLGAILYHIVTGRPPYAHSTVFALMDAVRAGNYTPLEEALGEVVVSKRLLRIIDKALAFKPSERYASAAQLKQEVQRFIGAGLHLPRVVFEAGTRVMSQGDSGDEAYIIVSGQCVASKTVNGEKRILRTMGPGDVFGEMAVLSNRPRSATVDAVDTVTALTISRALLNDGIGTETWLGTLIRALAERFRELDEAVHSR
jgi:serine/threonine-protein kinase